MGGREGQVKRWWRLEEMEEREYYYIGIILMNPQINFNSKKDDPDFIVSVTVLTIIFFFFLLSLFKIMCLFYVKVRITEKETE